MSPEQGSGARQLDGRSDIYSLGCVLYEMLSGDPPFTGSSAQAILVRKMTDSVPSLRVVRETVPEALEHAIVRSLAKVPGDRFGTAQRFADGLAEALYPPKQETKPARRYGLCLAAAAAVALVALVALIGVL